MSFNPNNLQLPQFPLSSLVNIPPLSLQNFQTSSVPLPTSVPSLLGKREFQTSPYSYHRRLEKKVKGNFQEDLLRTYMASQAVDQPWDHLSGNLIDHHKVNIRQNPGFGFEGVFSQASNGYPAPYPRQSMALSSFQNQLQATQNMNQVNKWMLEQHRLLQKGADQEDGLIIPKLEADEMNPALKSSAGNVHIKVDIAKIRSFKEKHKTWNKSKKQTPKSSLPVLTEFTKAFPDWDLRTIFDFLHSGKSREEFETKMKSRKPRKKRRVKRRGPVRYFNNVDGEQAGPEANR